jgi:hypothetical protein
MDYNLTSFSLPVLYLCGIVPTIRVEYDGCHCYQRCQNSSMFSQKSCELTAQISVDLSYNIEKLKQF